MLTVDQVCEIIRSEVGSKLPPDIELGSETAFEDLGLSSLQISDLIFGLEERLGTQFDPAEAAEVVTIGELVRLANAMAPEPAAHSADGVTE